MDKNKNIIDFLKNNKINGVAFGYMTKEVQEWVNNKAKNHQADIFKYYDNLGVWNSISNKDFKVFPNDIIYLLEDYKEDTPKATEGSWVEFEIKNGVFDYDNRAFSWWDWGCFLSYCEGCNTDDFTAFGGWKYEGYEPWVTAPLVNYVGHYYTNNYIDEKDDAGRVILPITPIKIKFWRVRQCDR